MTSLINIKSEMRERINQRLYTTKLCIEHLGVANPGPAEIRKFKDGWDKKYTVQFSGPITKVQKILKEQEVPPLLYDIRNSMNGWDWAGETDGSPDWWADTYGHNKCIVFYEEEDYILFKLLYKNS